MIPIAFRARREALGLNQAECASVFGVTQAAVSRWETGARTIPAGVVEELDALEQTAEKLIDDAVGAVESVGVEDAALFVYADDAALWAAHPEMDGLPAVVHRVAMALAARECEGVPLVCRGATS